ncbi:hypothetical protein ACFLRC_01785 [Candidatus Altiarchaeota archaeon]
MGLRPKAETHNLCTGLPVQTNPVGPIQALAKPGEKGVRRLVRRVHLTRILGFLVAKHGNSVSFFSVIPSNSLSCRVKEVENVYALEI